MIEVINIIKNFIIEHHLIEFIIPISLPFIFFHFIMNFLRRLNYKEIIKEDDNISEIEIEDNISNTIDNDAILSNNQFIKF